jgi:hypothetical protein
MASNRFPGPNYNQLITNDPQIIKVNMDIVEIGARRSVMPTGTTPGTPGSVHNAPNAPEMTIKHV